MANVDGAFLYIGTYPSEDAALADFALVKDLKSLGAVGSYDIAVVTKDADGKVHEHKEESATRHAGWGGVAVGALVGILFPPSVIVSAAVGGAVGAVSGHLWRGLSRSDVKELGELIDDGEAALLVIGESTIEAALTKADLKAEKTIAKELDVRPQDIATAIQESSDDLRCAPRLPATSSGVWLDQSSGAR
jgi:uncharacterized membrane protein